MHSCFLLVMLGNFETYCASIGRTCTGAAVAALAVIGTVIWRRNSKVCRFGWSSLLGVLLCLRSVAGGLLTAAGGAALAAYSTALPDVAALDASCNAIGVTTLDRVPIYDGQHMQQYTSTYANTLIKWSSGHFPWWIPSLRCRAAAPPVLASTATRTAGLALLMTVDMRYVDLVRPWAAEARAARVGCVLGAIGTGSTTSLLCSAAKRAGCVCLYDTAPRRPIERHSFAVRVRFRFAQQAVRRGFAQSILMHDADVFFRPGGLVKMAQTVLALPPSIDFALSDNGPRRKESFDDLNWGVAWISGSNRSLTTLDCVLAEWQNTAFDRPSKQTPNPALYFERSQPRVNHILEAAIVADRGAMPRVCTFERRGQDSMLRHMTGLSGAHAKLLCARAENVSRSPFALGQRKSKCVLAYLPPLNATARAQLDALDTALRLRASRGCTLALPSAVHRFKRVGFCQLFDPSSVPLEGVDAPVAALETEATWLDFEELQQRKGVIRAGSKERAQTPLVRLLNN